jgi:hypothetical protein
VHVAIGVAVLVLLAGLAFAAGFAAAKRRGRAPREIEVAPDPARDEAPPPERMTFTPHAAAGSPEWRAAMSDLGTRMRAAGVRLVVFAHGSFVGDDPLAIAQVLDGALPPLPELARKLRRFTRDHVSRLLGDLCNYSGDYAAAFAEATGVEALAFTWSGENHHAARVQGAVRLARALALHGGGALGPGDRALLVGHSHGGQLFAVLSQLIAQSHGHEELVAAARARGEDVGALEDHLAVLRRCALDVATFGMPPRYGWARGARIRLLHVVNHHSARAHAPSLRGWLHTRGGDYIQHVGTHGSDLPPLSSNDRAVNARLDRILGHGSSLRAWLHHLAAGPRVSPHGHTVLIDYGDSAPILPNFWATGLGHSAYTREDAMLFHARLLTNHFYPARGGSLGERPWSERVRAWIAPERLLPPPRR